ncbi:MAG TPA: gamma-glutamyltransferase, partial [Acidimicrobiales bacterium]|nr:gamma-glutamyltransferase [Acidimicrobiales bacterium]
TGLRGMVNAADQLASMAGVRLLDHGGSAADAAVAAAAVMAVTSPHLCGLGGDMLAMISEPGSPPTALLGVGRSGSGVDAARMRAEGHSVMPLRGDPRSAPVPGAVDGWLALHHRFGRLPLEEVLAPAIELAEEGFLASLLLALSSHLVADVAGAHELCPGGPRQLGSRVRLPGVARMLRTIAAEGRDGFYKGEFGRALLEMGDGVFTPADFDRTLADWYEPVRLGVWAHDLWTVPPPSQGYLTLASSWIAEQSGLGDDPNDPSWAHLVVEASRAAGFDRPEVLHELADGSRLVAEDRLSAAASRILRDRAAPSDVAVGSPDPTGSSTPRLGDGDTTHLCAIDADGLGISLTQSNALDYGSHLVVGDTGVFLHNRGVGFSLEEDHPAELAPGRRPAHTLSPMLATRVDGSLSHLVGAMGGDAQPQILLQILARMLRGGQDPAAAVAGARLALDAPSAGPFRLWWGDDLSIRVESDAPSGWIHDLRHRGHHVQTISAFDPVVVGCAQVISVVGAGNSVDRHYVGAADPRSPEGGTVGR